MSLKGSAKPGYIITGKVTEASYILMTAYGIALKNGFEGTEEEWLESQRGLSAYEIALKYGFEGDEEAWLDSLDGSKVPVSTLKEVVEQYFAENPVANGKDGRTPVKGTDYFTADDVNEIVNEVVEIVGVNEEKTPITAISMTETDDTMTATFTLEDGSTSTSEVTFDADDNPTKIIVDGVEVPITWG